MHTLDMAERRLSQREQILAAPEMIDRVSEAPAARIANGHVAAGHGVADVFEGLEGVRRPRVFGRPVRQADLSSGLHGAVQRRVVSEFELVDGDAIRRELDHLVDGSAPCVGAFAGQPCQQIDVDLVESRVACLFVGFEAFAYGNVPPIGPQNVVVQCLEAEA
jgi:hypothetical protein